MTEQIVFYGKGGVGKSTLISNISAAMVEAGFKVMQVGCDPKADSCSILNGGFPIPTVSDRLRKNGSFRIADEIHQGFKGINCIELGDPGNGDSGAFLEIQKIFDLIEQGRLFEETKPDYALYDVSGEHSFAEYHEPIRQLGARLVYVVTTADFMSLSAANTIYATLERLGESQVPIPFGGLIPNGISNSFEESLISDFAKHTRTNTLGRVPRSLVVRQCELYGKTVIEAAPLSNQSYYYRRLANQIVDQSNSLKIKNQPQALTGDGLRSWAREWADRLYVMENGLVTDGAAI
ncbi:MAG: AAA family ATPase [Steroidobacteraceae bacterium]|nr:AAA family ATPase [Deltaproteobacteria bacterium]